MTGKGRKKSQSQEMQDARVSSASLRTLGEHTRCQALPKCCVQMLSHWEFFSWFCLLYLFAFLLIVLKL